ncbi:MAG: hypothetical protein H0U54_06460 [Acidobacteria bacterium]|nr:hypothetical protein [Acidobacteriota bacterium]
MAKVNIKPTNLIAVLCCLCSVLFLEGCSYQEALSGKHEGTVESHQLTINKPCSLFTENTIRIETSPGQTKYQYTCGNTRVFIVLKNEELTVNEKSYGKLKDGDSIVFDHGKVLINSKEVQEVASN